MSDAIAPLVLIVEDDASVRQVLDSALHAEGYRTLTVATLREGISSAFGFRPDLVLLDLGLPDGPGTTLITALRPERRTPIIILSARGEEHAKVAALDAGADDYLTKPFSIVELLARIRVALRHAHEPMDPDASATFNGGGVRIDPARREVFREGERVHLTRTEYRLLLALVRHAGRVATHRHLLTEVWGPTAVDHPHYLRVYMAQLRNKLEADPANPVLLRTEPGVGYRLMDHT